MRILAAAFLGLACGGAAQAEVVGRFDSGFRTRNIVEVAAPPGRVYAALGELDRWWNGAHSYSGQAANLSIVLEPGGCFCERLPQGGGVRHGVVVAAWPGRLVRIDGALGPLQSEGVAATLSFEIRPKGQGSEVVQTYNVGGARPELVASMADPVDKVVGEQLLRLERYVETGRPQ